MQELQQENSQGSSSIFNISIEGFQQIQEAGIDLNGLFILECFAEGTDITKHMKSSMINAWKQTLTRKGLINGDGVLTTMGSWLLKSVKEGSSIKAIGSVHAVKRQMSSDFELWWKAYPSTDIFEYKGKKFSGTRGLKVKKEECRLKITKILNSGRYTINDLIQSLECEVNMKKEASLKDGENKMRFMVNSLSYLNQGLYENFMEVSKTYKPDTNSPKIIGI